MLKIGTQNELTRQLWVKKELEKISKGRSILDAGAGEQQYKQYCKHLQYTSQDFAEYSPEEIEQGLQMNKWDYGKLDIVSDITNIPVKNANYDVILCTEVFEHIPDPQSALKEFSRIIKQGGTLILTAPFASYTHFAPYHYSTGFSKYYYYEILPKFGFEIIKIENNGNYFELIAQELWRLPSMARKYCDNLILSILFKYLSFGLAIILIFIINLINFNSKRSEEFAVFGYHIICRKK